MPKKVRVSEALPPAGNGRLHDIVAERRQSLRLGRLSHERGNSNSPQASPSRKPKRKNDPASISGPGWIPGAAIFEGYPFRFSRGFEYLRLGQKVDIPDAFLDASGQRQSVPVWGEGR